MIFTRRLFHFPTVIVLILCICSCGLSDQDVSHSEDTQIDSAIPIETYSEHNNLLQTEAEFEQSSYSVVPCVFECDVDTNRIYTRYDDTSSNEEGYVIDYDLTYYDYGVHKVSLYRASHIDVPPADILNDEAWIPVTSYAFGVLRTWSHNEERQESIFNSAVNYSIDDIESFPLLESLVADIDDQYSLFDCYFAYPYPVGIMNMISDDDVFSMTRLDDGEELMVNEDLVFITLRDSLGGLPIGVPNDNRASFNRISYGDIYGSIDSMIDEYYCDYYDSDESILIDYIHPSYDYQLIEDSTGSVMPLDQCIQNSIGGILLKADNYGNHYCYAYAAELVYIPFLVGSDGFGSGYTEVDFVPVWAIYIAAYGGGGVYQAETSVVYLNATTGELLSRGL